MNVFIHFELGGRGICNRWFHICGLLAPPQASFSFNPPASEHLKPKSDPVNNVLTALLAAASLVVSQNVQSHLIILLALVPGTRTHTH